MRRSDSDPILSRLRQLGSSFAVIAKALERDFAISEGTPLTAIFDVISDLALLGLEVTRLPFFRTQDANNPEVIFSSKPGDPLTYQVDSLGNPRSMKIQAPGVIWDEDEVTQLLEEIAEAALEARLGRIHRISSPMEPSLPDNIRQPLKRESRFFFRRQRDHRKQRR